MIGSIARRWRVLSGQDNWKNLLDPLDSDLRRYLLHYGAMAQATYDAFNSEKASKYAGDSQYATNDLFSKVGLRIANPFKYRPVKYFLCNFESSSPPMLYLEVLVKGGMVQGIKLDGVYCGGYRRGSDGAGAEGHIYSLLGEERYRLLNGFLILSSLWCRLLKNCLFF